MPAINMSGPLVVPANPSGGHAVLMDPFSGPKNSPKDAKVASFYDNLPAPGGFPYVAPVNDPTNFSTGALSTGIGIGMDVGVADAGAGFVVNATVPQVVANTRLFTDNYIPGVTYPDGIAVEAQATLIAIGGGRSVATAIGAPNFGAAIPNPWTGGFAIAAFGNGASRDAGAGPVFTSFPVKVVTAAADVAVDAVIETGFVNRSGKIVRAGQSEFGSASAAQAALA